MNDKKMIKVILGLFAGILVAMSVIGGLGISLIKGGYSTKDTLQTYVIVSEGLLFFLCFSFFIITAFWKRSIEETERNENTDLMGKKLENDEKTFFKAENSVGSGAHYIDKKNDFIEKVKGKVSKIHQESELLSKASEKIAGNSSTVIFSVQEVAKSAGKQSEELFDIQCVMEQFGMELGIMVKAIEEIDGKTHSMDALANGSHADMQNLRNSMERIHQLFMKFAEHILQFKDKISQIHEITQFINSVSNQTNLLALNASIEAVRAGEAGKGFSVVANEIRKLAEKSKASLENINGVIRDVSQESQNMIQMTDRMNLELRNQKERIYNSIDAFTKIIEEIQYISPKIDEVSEYALHINKDKDLILEKVGDSSMVIQDISASVEEISSSFEGVNGAIQEIASSSQSYNSMSMELERIITDERDKMRIEI